MKIVVAGLLILLTAMPAAAGERQDRAKTAAMSGSNCVQIKARNFSSQAEPAETLVMAAMGLCVGEAGEFRHRLREATREYGLPFASTADDESIGRAYAQVEQHIRNIGVSAVIQARAQ